jgi:methyl-accepting chemotaxis protein
MQKEPLMKVVGDIVKACPTPAFLLDRNLSLTENNDAMEALIGYTKEEMIKLKIGQLLATNVSNREANIQKSIAAGMDIKDPKADVRKKNGEIIICSVNIKPILDEMGEYAFALVFIDQEDTTHRMESKLYLYEQILDSIPWPLSVTDNEMNWVFINKPVEDMLKVKRNEVVGKQCSNWNANICKTKNCGIARLKEKQPQTFFEQSNMNFEVNTSYIKDRNGNNLGHLEIVQDITAKQKNEEYRTIHFNNLVANMKKISEGDLNIDTAVADGDEYTKENRAIYLNINDKLSKIKTNIGAMVLDAHILAKAAVDGKLETRVDANKHPGEFGKIIQGVDDTLDAVIKPLSVAADYVDKISKGEVPAKITDDYKGDFDVLKKNLNQCIDGLGGLVESSTVLQRMAENDYTTMVKGSYSGVYANVAASVNTVKERIEHTIFALAKVSNGDFSELEALQKIGNGAGRRCENDHLIPTSIRMIENIKALAMDTEMLSKAAVEGKLETRADVSKHNGEYKKIVQGVNDTLDAVIVPINEAMRIADSYAGGDLTARVEIETQGDFKKFAASLDKIGESLTDLLREVNNSVSMVSSTSQELASSAEEMNASTEQVSSAIQQISKGAQSQASQVDETAKAMKEMSASVEKVVTRSKESSDTATKTNESANVGKTTVENTVKKMQEIQKVVIESAKVIESLGKRSEEIGEIVVVITNISEQTNLLALNAAIEAARAGDQGRGFAVVAEEVKNLAEDSREAAERIAKMIKEVQSETGKAVEAMHRGTKETAEGMQFVEMTGKAFSDIQGLAATTTAGVIEISNLMNSQKEGTQHAAKSVDDIASIAEETASASEESAASTEELTASMEDMTARAQALSEMSVNLQKIAGQFNIGTEAESGHAKIETTRPVAPKKAVAKKAPMTAPKAEEAKMPTKVKEALRKRGIEAEN